LADDVTAPEGAVETTAVGGPEQAWHEQTVAAIVKATTPEGEEQRKPDFHRLAGGNETVAKIASSAYDHKLMAEAGFGREEREALVEAVRLFGDEDYEAAYKRLEQAFDDPDTFNSLWVGMGGEFEDENEGANAATDTIEQPATALVYDLLEPNPTPTQQELQMRFFQDMADRLGFVIDPE
jgi:hypothetical protein